MINISQIFSEYKVIPIINCSNIDELDNKIEILKEIDYKVFEIVIRNENSINLIEYARNKYDDFIIAAGTVLNAETMDIVSKLGVDLIISPGSSKKLIDFSKTINIPYIPAAASITEIQNLIEEGFKFIKLFPISLLGGVDFLKAIDSIYKNTEVKFILTGGINLKNYKDYLGFNSVLGFSTSSFFEKNILLKKRKNLKKYLIK